MKYGIAFILVFLALCNLCDCILRAERLKRSPMIRRMPWTYDSSRSTLYAKKFDPSKFVEATIMKPLGIDLVEVEMDAPKGVMIGDLNPDGNAKKSGQISKGLFLVAINGIDTKYKTFDEILDIIGAADDTVQLTCVAPNDVFKGKAVLTVKTQDGQTLNVECLKGQMMRDVLLGAGIGGLSRGREAYQLWWRCLMWQVRSGRVTR